MKQTISNNINPLLQMHRLKESTQNSKLCNCRQKKILPTSHGKCLTKCVVYKATVTEKTSINEETFIGLTENEFKTGFNLHTSSFKLEHKGTSTTLGDHVWKKKKLKTSTSTSNRRSSNRWSYSHHVRKCANFAFRKNSSSLGLHHLWKKKCVDITCTISNSS